MGYFLWKCEIPLNLAFSDGCVLVGRRKRRFVFAMIAEMFACLGIFQEMPQICWSE